MDVFDYAINMCYSYRPLILETEWGEGTRLRPPYDWQHELEDVIEWGMSDTQLDKTNNTHKPLVRWRDGDVTHERCEHKLLWRLTPFGKLVRDELLTYPPMPEFKRGSYETASECYDWIKSGFLGYIPADSEDECTHTKSVQDWHERSTHENTH